MSVLIVLGQSYLQKQHNCYDYHYQPVEFHYHHELVLFIKRLIVVIGLGIVALRLDIRLLIAPPLIVAFFELSGHHKKLRSQVPRLYIFTVFMAFVGAYVRYYLTIQYQVPLWIVATIATAILLIGIYSFQIFFPPVDAITILPMIIAPEILLSYPFLVAIGFALLIIFAFMISYQKSS